MDSQVYSDTKSQFHSYIYDEMSRIYRVSVINDRRAYASGSISFAFKMHLKVLLCTLFFVLFVRAKHPRIDPNEEVKKATLKKSLASSVLPIVAETMSHEDESGEGVPIPPTPAEKVVYCDLMKEFTPTKTQIKTATTREAFSSFPQTRDIDVLYINLDRSVERRESMERHLSMYGFRDHTRVRAVTPKELIIPHTISAPELCNKLTNDSIAGLTSSRAVNLLSMGASGKASSEYRPLIITQCGRKKNTKGELTVTISHLKAMYTALKLQNNRKYD